MMSVCVYTRGDKDGTILRVLSGREMNENREAFGFDVRV